MNEKQLFEAGLFAVQNASDMNLTLTEYFILGYIRYRSDVTINMLANETKMNRTTVSKALKKLEEKGVVICGADASDKRKKIYEFKN